MTLDSPHECAFECVICCESFEDIYECPQCHNLQCHKCILDYAQLEISYPVCCNCKSQIQHQTFITNDTIYEQFSETLKLYYIKDHNSRVSLYRPIVDIIQDIRKYKTYKTAKFACTYIVIMKSLISALMNDYEEAVRSRHNRKINRGDNLYILQVIPKVITAVYDDCPPYDTTIKYIHDIIAKGRITRDTYDRLFTIIDNMDFDIWNIDGTITEYVKISRMRDRRTINEVITDSYEQYRTKNITENTNVKLRDCISPCSQPSCNGGITHDYTCNTCEVKYCDKCLKVFTGDFKDHICDSNDVKTWQMLLNESHPCPACATRIYRISGCNDMFCTNCHIGFDWVTGNIIRRDFHNEHRHAWLNEHRNIHINRGDTRAMVFNDIKYRNIKDLILILYHFSTSFNFDNGNNRVNFENAVDDYIMYNHLCSFNDEKPHIPVHKWISMLFRVGVICSDVCHKILPLLDAFTNELSEKSLKVIIRPRQSLIRRNNADEPKYETVEHSELESLMNISNMLNESGCAIMRVVTDSQLSGVTESRVMSSSIYPRSVKSYTDDLITVIKRMQKIPDIICAMNITSART